MLTPSACGIRSRTVVNSLPETYIRYSRIANKGVAPWPAQNPTRKSCTPELQAYLGERFRTLLANLAFVEALSGHLPGDLASQERLPDLEATLRHLARLSPP